MLLIKYVLGLLFIFLTFASIQAQSFTQFLKQLSTTPDSLRQARVDSFYTAQSQLPLIENDTLVTFIYRGSAGAVSWAGDANGWDPSASPLEKAAGTNLWFRQQIYEANARLDYKLVINNGTWILDPKNPNTIRGGFGPNSELRMPEYVFPLETLYRSGIQHGSIRDTLFASTALGNSRPIKVYLPPGYSSDTDSYPCLIVHDGLDYLSLGSAVNVIDNLIDEKKIRPLIALFIPPVNRNPEYAGDQRESFAKFVVNEVYRWAKSRYRILEGPENSAVMGASNGGNISLYMALSYPTIFGKVGAQSSNVESYLATGFRQAEKRDLQIYMDLGKYDLAILIPRVRNFVLILQEKGYDYFYREYPEGHSWGFWRAHIDDILLRFFPITDTGVGKTEKVQPKGFRLGQNYPNPFNGETSINLTVGSSSFLSARVYNVLGTKIRTLLEGNVAAGKHLLRWDGKDELQHQVSSGTYFLTVLAQGNLVEIRKMVLLR